MSLAQSWHVFRRDPPGQRFTKRYERLARLDRGVWHRALRLGIGVVLVLVGIVFMPLPGPGFVPLLAGAAVMAGESRRIARALDRAEIGLRSRFGSKRGG